MRQRFTPEMNESLESRALMAANPLHAEVRKLAHDTVGSPSSQATIHASATSLRSSLLGQYQFNGNGFDSSGKSSQFWLSNTKFSNGSLYLNGIYDFNNPDQNGYRARVNADYLSFRKFTVAVTFKSDSSSTNPYETPLLVGGENDRWFVLKRNNEGKLAVRLNNHVYEYAASSDTKIVTGKWTTVVCGIDVDTKRLTAYMNGQKMIDVALPSDFQFNVVNTPDEVSDRIWTFTNYSNGTTFKGYIDAFSYYNRKLTNQEMQKLSATGRR
ncbi:MAG: LamG-like jellyroll fold domain-containing protein [bacterium]